MCPTFPSRAARRPAQRRHPPVHPFQRHVAFNSSYSARSSGLRSPTYPAAEKLPQIAPLCRHPDPAPSHTPCHCPQSARTRRDETRPRRAISGSPTSPLPSRSAARRREAPNDAAKLRRSSFHSYLHSRANLRSPADPGRICYIPVRSKGRRRPRRSERTVPPTPLHAT